MYSQSRRSTSWCETAKDGRVRHGENQNVSSSGAHVHWIHTTRLLVMLLSAHQQKDPGFSDFRAIFDVLTSSMSSTLCVNSHLSDTSCDENVEDNSQEEEMRWLQRRKYRDQTKSSAPAKPLTRALPLITTGQYIPLHTHRESDALVLAEPQCKQHRNRPSSWRHTHDDDTSTSPRETDSESSAEKFKKHSREKILSSEMEGTKGFLQRKFRRIRSSNSPPPQDMPTRKSRSRNRKSDSLDCYQSEHVSSTTTSRTTKNATTKARKRSQSVPKRQGKVRSWSFLSRKAQRLDMVPSNGPKDIPRKSPKTKRVSNSDNVIMTSLLPLPPKLDESLTDTRKQDQATSERTEQNPVNDLPSRVSTIPSAAMAAPFALQIAAAAAAAARENELQQSTKTKAETLQKELDTLREQLLQVQKTAMEEQQLLRNAFEKKKEILHENVTNSFRYENETNEPTQQVDLQQQQQQELELELAFLKAESKSLKKELSELTDNMLALHGDNEALENDTQKIEAMFLSLTHWAMKSTKRQTRLQDEEAKLQAAHNELVALVVGPKQKEAYRQCMYRVVRGVHEADMFDHALYEEVLDMVQFCEIELGNDVLHEDNNLFATNHILGTDDDLLQTGLFVPAGGIDDNVSCACSSLTNTLYKEAESSENEEELLATLALLQKLWVDGGRKEVDLELLRALVSQSHALK